MTPGYRRVAAIVVVLIALLFGGSHLAGTVVRGLTAPLAGIELLAQRPSAQVPPGDPLPELEFTGDSSAEPDIESEAIVQPEAQKRLQILKGGNAAVSRAMLRLTEAKEGFIEIELAEGLYFAASGSRLTLDHLSQLERELGLSPLQRERIERWLNWKKESLDALGGNKDPQKVREIEESTAEAVRAELDFFQAQEFDHRRPGEATFMMLSRAIAASDEKALVDYVVADKISAVNLQTTLRPKARVALKAAE